MNYILPKCFILPLLIHHQQQPRSNDMVSDSFIITLFSFFLSFTSRFPYLLFFYISRLFSVILSWNNRWTSHSFNSYRHRARFLTFTYLIRFNSHHSSLHAFQTCRSIAIFLVSYVWAMNLFRLYTPNFFTLIINSTRVPSLSLCHT